MPVSFKKILVFNDKKVYVLSDTRILGLGFNLLLHKLRTADCSVTQGFEDLVRSRNQL